MLVLFYSFYSMFYLHPPIANILLTPFRVQNVPPPMSSCQLAPSSSALPPSIERSRTPIHASFSLLSDTLAVLWESGYIEIWSLKTRLEGGRGKIMDPSQVWSGFVNCPLAREHKQLLLSSSDASGTWSTLTVLSSGRENDIISIVDLDNYDSIRTSVVELPHCNCRLIATDTETMVQGPNGEILRCLCRPHEHIDF